MPGSLGGVLVVNRLNDEYGDSFEPDLLGAVAGALMLASAATLYRALFRPGLVARERESAILGRRVSRVGTIVIGAVLGFILGITSVGSGAPSASRSSCSTSSPRGRWSAPTSSTQPFSSGPRA